MNCRHFFRERLATAETTALPEWKIAFQFFRPIPAVLKNPTRSFFMFNLFHLTGPGGSRRFGRALQNHIRQQ